MNVSTAALQLYVFPPRCKHAVPRHTLEVRPRRQDYAIEHRDRLDRFIGIYMVPRGELLNWGRLEHPVTTL
jgi:hypothetical protein